MHKYLFQPTHFVRFDKSIDLPASFFVLVLRCIFVSLKFYFELLLYRPINFPIVLQFRLFPLELLRFQAPEMKENRVLSCLSLL